MKMKEELDYETTRLAFKWTQIPLAIIYFLFLSSMIFFFCITQIRKKFKTKFSSTFFLICLFGYSIFRLLYFIMSITEFGQTTIVISMISYDIGSSSFYVAFLIFMLYW